MTVPFIDDLPFDGVPEPAGMPCCGDRFVKALRVAVIAHGGQRRKSSRPESRPIPYISHPLGVCSIAQGYEADEEEAIAALLHGIGIPLGMLMVNRIPFVFSLHRGCA